MEIKFKNGSKITEIENTNNTRGGNCESKLFVLTEDKMTNFEKKYNELKLKHGYDEIIKLDFTKFESIPKLYLAGGLFNDGDQLFNAMVEDICDSIGVEYYSPQSAPFNDKASTSAIITNQSIFNGDMKEVLSSNYILNHATCPLDNGVATEMGIVTGYNSQVDYESDMIGIVTYADDIRFSTDPNPSQKGVDNQTMYINSFSIASAQDTKYSGESALGIHYNLFDIFNAIYAHWETKLKNIEVEKEFQSRVLEKYIGNGGM